MEWEIKFLKGKGTLKNNYNGKRMEVEKALAFNAMATITVVKSFIVHGLNWSVFFVVNASFVLLWFYHRKIW